MMIANEESGRDLEESDRKFRMVLYQNYFRGTYEGYEEAQSDN
jgi:hypothetical protein